MSARNADQSVVVVTGASSGIGRAAALAFAARGDCVVLAARHAETLESAATECEQAGGRALAVPTDVSDEAAVRHLAARANEHFGRIDVWINCAGVIIYGEFENVPSEVYEQLLRTNLFGQIYGTRAVLPYFRQRDAGVVVCIGSVWSSVSSPYVGAYVVSKFGVRAFSESMQEALRLEVGSRNIHVCTILPQSVDTPIFRHGANYTGRQAKPVPPVVSTQRVVRTILRSVAHPNRRRRTVGNWGRFIEVGHAVAPAIFNRLVPAAMNLAALGRKSAPSGPGNLFDPIPDWNQVDGHWRNWALRVGIGAAAVTATGAAAYRIVRQCSD